MSKKPSDLFEASGHIVHMAPFRERRPRNADLPKSLELSLVNNFREQNEMLSEQNRTLKYSVRDMHSRLDRLTNGLDRLVGEMHGIRTGKRDEAFARVAETGAAADLPTVRPDATLIYGVTATDIGDQLGFRPSEIGLLLSARGLGWADNPDYQEITRRKRATSQRFWVNDMALRLSKVLDENEPDRRGVRDKATLAIFRKWKERKLAAAEG